jgi:hypothetical protein
VADRQEDDPALLALLELQAALKADAEKSGDGPSTKRKSDFRSEAERALFIDAWGLEVYQKLPD